VRGEEAGVEREGERANKSGGLAPPPNLKPNFAHGDVTNLARWLSCAIAFSALTLLVGRQPEKVSEEEETDEGKAHCDKTVLSVSCLA